VTNDFFLQRQKSKQKKGMEKHFMVSPNVIAMNLFNYDSVDVVDNVIVFLDCTVIHPELAVAGHTTFEQISFDCTTYTFHIETSDGHEMGKWHISKWFKINNDHLIDLDDSVLIKSAAHDTNGENDDDD
jgi:hypothetical protein